MYSFYHSLKYAVLSKINIGFIIPSLSELGLKGTVVNPTSHNETEIHSKLRT